MKIKDLEDVAKILNVVIEKAKSSKKDVDQIELEKTAFHKFQLYVAWWEAIARKKVMDKSNDKKLKEKALDVLSRWMFMKEHLEIFIEHEMQDERDKINLH